MDWWDEAEVTFTPQPTTKEADAKSEPIKATISCLPSQHSSGRSGFDKDCTLWASWGIKSSEKTVWFGGDTGYRTVPKVAEGIDDRFEEAEQAIRHSAAFASAASPASMKPPTCRRQSCA